MYNAGKLNCHSLMIALIIILSALPQELSFWAFPDSYTREYGSVFSCTIPFFLTLVFLYLSPNKIIIRVRLFKNPLILFLTYGIISLCFVILNNLQIKFYFVAAYKYLTYIFMFLLITSNVNLQSFATGLQSGYRIGLLLQTVVGWLYVFGGILVPFIGGYSNSVRNGFSRMVGTFRHPGDFSLYMTISFIYFLCSYFFQHNKKDAFFAFIAFLNIFFSGARAMLLTSLLLFLFLIIKKYRRHFVAKLSVVVSFVMGIIYFIQSEAFYDIFVAHSFSDMFVARFVHWIMGFEIMLDNPVNLLCGVGLNNLVHYIDSNYSKYAVLVAIASAVLDSDFVRGMPIHNAFLIVGTELGVIGLILYLRIYKACIKKLVTQIKTSKSNNFICHFTLLSFFVFAIYSIQGWAFMKNFGWTMFILSISYATLLFDEHKNMSNYNRFI